MTCTACDHPESDHHPYGGKCHAEVMYRVGAIECHCDGYRDE